MRKDTFEIFAHEKIAKDVFELSLHGNTDGICPGQFVNVKTEPQFLRRPISVCDVKNEELTLIFKVVGTGTEILSKKKIFDQLDLLLPLGNGYNIEKSGQNPVLIGGGVGIPPLFYLAKKLLSQGKNVTALLGFNSNQDAFLIDDFKAIGATVRVATVDGSLFEKGFVTDLFHDDDNFSYFYSCGPLIMMKNVFKTVKIDGEFSLEERMGCGFGACVGCSIETKAGVKRVCKDGPVFLKEELKW